MRDGSGARVVGRIRAHVLHAEEITLVVAQSKAKQREEKEKMKMEMKQKKELENAEKRKIQEKMEAKIERESRKIVTPGGTGLRASGASSSISGGGSKFRTPSSKRPGTGGKTPRRFGL